MANFNSLLDKGAGAEGIIGEVLLGTSLSVLRGKLIAKIPKAATKWDSAMRARVARASLLRKIGASSRILAGDVQWPRVRLPLPIYR